MLFHIYSGNNYRFIKTENNGYLAGFRCSRFALFAIRRNLEARAFLGRNTRLLKAAHACEAPSRHHCLILVPRRAWSPYQSDIRRTKSLDSQGVVNICSPVNTAFAPAIKHIACSASDSVCLPAARRIIVPGIVIRAVAMVRRRV